ncbi:MAG: electron transport complex subunit RsxD [Gallionellales bacterium 35-53-114]|jgi:electron transport complex protein RnfD|nr:MAG: electron transport complex subunit RsxD [Gallionellales bacterium 35-53-114]OYZ62296.1 MAG: electron transport complex subunit RsxD [Gallionellales bacterium 24-53-125]OZB10583.1 MAG: electron transport complex subunit RsxD [Gallionellales bacterium 39-52-133]HQS57214.1 electron transport complex subunit RsxD [Gallionellaceae bacterium]HQS74598.1 electron transport complex subunit RsxD [Gallionellaceae bacterium]
MFPPFTTQASSVREIMFKVLLALLPGIALYVWYFGPAILVSITLASLTALATEAVMLKLRRRPLAPFLSDNSALLTAWLLALSIPPLAPWWLVVVGTMFAISVAKHLYGGLGSNPFNPAMVGYAVLIISFPAYMTHWLAPQGLGQLELNFMQQLGYIFGGHFPAGVTVDAVSMATPLDTLKTQLHSAHSMGDILQMPVYGNLGGKGSEMVALGFVIGGIYLLANRIISWHLPLTFLAALFATAGAFYLFDPAHYAPPLFHWFSGAAMLAAFFILTDPVTSPTTIRGKFIFAAGAGFLTYIIRVFGGFPDGVAFATLLMNMCVPLIDAYTQPKVFGKKGEQ